MKKKGNRKITVRDQMTEFLLYSSPDGDVKVEVFLADETIWLPQKRISELFGVGIPAISKHLANIFESGELVEDAVISILETTAADGKIYKTKYYNLDAILTMDGFSESVNKFLDFNEFRILDGFGSVSRKDAEAKAHGEYDVFNKTQVIESDFDRMIKKLPDPGDNE